MSDATQELSSWVQSLSYEHLRGVEDTQSARCRSTGRRLRGLELAPGLYLSSRDRRFYATDLHRPFVADELALPDVLARVTFAEIKREFAAKFQANKRAMLSRRAFHAQRARA